MSAKDQHRAGQPNLNDRTPQQPWTSGYSDRDDRSSRNYDSRDSENFARKEFTEVQDAKGVPLATDECIRTEANERLFGATFDASGIEVVSVDGVATLRGLVDDLTCRERAAELVSGIVGVVSVRNELKIRAG